MNNRLSIVETDSNAQHSKKTKYPSREEKIGKLERMWLKDPEQFNPQRNAIERIRVKRTLELLKKHLSLTGKEAADLGCGEGTISRLLRNEGAHITAVDAAANALNRLEQKGIDEIEPLQDCLPHTRLPDDGYDIVVSTEVIAYLPSQEFRLYMAELARLVKKEGWILCSTPFALRTEGGPAEFHALAETEMQIEESLPSYHTLALKWIHLLEAPQKYVKGAQDLEERHTALQTYKKCGQYWYRLQTKAPFSWLWKIVSFVTTPLSHWISQSEKTILFFEKVSRFFWAEAGITHLTVIGKRRPLILPPDPKELPRELKQKRSVWE